MEVAIGLIALESILGADSTLSGYAPGGVRRGLAPDDVAIPYVIIAHQANSDVKTGNEVQVFTSVLFQAKIVGPAALSSQLINGANRIHTLLGGDQGLRGVPITGGGILACWRESQIQTDEMVNTDVWSNFGGFYRMQIQETS